MCAVLTHRESGRSRRRRPSPASMPSRRLGALGVGPADGASCGGWTPRFHWSPSAQPGATSRARVSASTHSSMDEAVVRRIRFVVTWLRLRRQHSPKPANGPREESSKTGARKREPFRSEAGGVGRESTRAGREAQRRVEGRCGHADRAKRRLPLGHHGFCPLEAGRTCHTLAPN